MSKYDITLKFIDDALVQFEWPHFPPQLLSLFFEFKASQQSFLIVFTVFSSLQHDLSSLIPQAKPEVGINKKPIVKIIRKW